MQHKLLDSLIQLRVYTLIRDFSRNKRVDILSCVDLIFLGEENQHMHVWQSSLLILNCIDQSRHLTKEPISDSVD